MPRQSLAKSASYAGSATLTSRLLGLVREQVLAAYFGASHEMDAFVLAFRIPNLLRDLFAEGAMSAAFVPTFTKALATGGAARGWRLGNSILNGLLLVTGTFVVAGVFAATPLVTTFGGDFAQVPGKLDLAILLTRVILPFLVLQAIAAAVMGMLNSLGHYFTPALSPATFNLAAIVCVVALTPVMPALGLPPIMSVVIATLVGGLAQIAMQWPSLYRAGFRYRPLLEVRDPAFRQVLLLMGPGTIGLAATQVNVLVTTLLAARAGAGVVSWLQYAFRVMYLPIGLVGVSIATAVLPTVSRDAAIRDFVSVRRTVSHGVALMLVVNIPATVGLWLLAPETVRLLFERGRFGEADTIATTLAVQCYAVGLIGYSAVRIVSPVFYALGRSRIAVLLSTTSIAFNVVLSLLLVPVMGFAGLPLATSLAALFNGAVSLVMLRREVGALEGRRLVITGVKALLASGVMAIVARVVLALLTVVWPGAGVVAQTARLGVTIAMSVAALVACTWLLGIAEAIEMVDRVKRRLKRPQAA